MAHPTHRPTGGVQWPQTNLESLPLGVGSCCPVQFNRGVANYLPANNTPGCSLFAIIYYLDTRSWGPSRSKKPRHADGPIVIIHGFHCLPRTGGRGSGAPISPGGSYSKHLRAAKIISSPELCKIDETKKISSTMLQTSR